MKLNYLSACTLAASVAIVTGCAGRAEVWPNSDPSLRRTAAEFAADAARRHPYKADAPRGGEARARVEIGYVWDRLDVANTSDSAWTDVELWVNGQYVVFLSRMEPKAIKSVPFQALYDEKGQSFPTGNGKMFGREPVVVKKIELFRDGKLYDVKFQNAE